MIEIGSRAVDLLNTRIRQPHLPSRRSQLDPLFVRDSVRQLG